jgi:hypothetical protein
MKEVKEDLGADANARVHIFPTLKNIIIKYLGQDPPFFIFSQNKY